jgi:hypothetical protein
MSVAVIGPVTNDYRQVFCSYCGTYDVWHTVSAGGEHSSSGVPMPHTCTDANFQPFFLPKETGMPSIHDRKIVLIRGDIAIMKVASSPGSASRIATTKSSPMPSLLVALSFSELPG